MEALKSCIYETKTVHSRLAPVKHQFQYDFFMVMLDLAEAPTLNLKTLGINKKHWLYSFLDKDHGARDGTSALNWVTQHCETSLGFTPDRVRLLFIPRLFRYAFNPLCIYFCEKNNKPAAVLYQVGNALRQQHGYLFPLKDDDTHRHHGHKEFHVSPYMPMDMDYHFQLKWPGEDVSLVITSHEDDAPIQIATLNGTSIPLSDANLKAMTWRYFPMPFKITWRILKQALYLKLKGLRFNYAAPLPDHDVTVYKD